jgi:hypothetical protein
VLEDPAATVAADAGRSVGDPQAAVIAARITAPRLLVTTTGILLRALHDVSSG